MNIGIAQILITLLVIIILFGNLPKITKDIITSLKEIKKTLHKEEQQKLENNQTEDNSNKHNK